MLILRSLAFVFIVGSLSACSDPAGDRDPGAFNANPKATAEARALVDALYEISGQGMLAGQHENATTEYADRIREITGSYPAIRGHDFSYAHRIPLRSHMIEKAKRDWENGVLVMFMWHATRPMDEPGDDLASVRGKLSVAEWDSLMTPGTRIHERWLEQIDSVAVLLKELDEAGVPVLWRPYHEMNGAWFWWGRKGGDYRRLWRRLYERYHYIIDPMTDWLEERSDGTGRGGWHGPVNTAALVPKSFRIRNEGGFTTLWRMMYERYTHHHGLHNLVWVWSVAPPADPLHTSRDPLEPYYPGHEYVDVLALDIALGALEDIDPSYHDQLVALGNGKPVGIAELGRFPNLSALSHESQWVFAMMWRELSLDPERNTVEEMRRFYDDPLVLSREDLRERLDRRDRPGESATGSTAH